MKTSVQVQKSISILMSFIFLSEFSGCYTQRILTPSEITASDYYLIHTTSATYPAYQTKISDGILSGNLDFNTMNSTDLRYTNIYLLSDSLFIINGDRFTLPVNSIKEIKQRVQDKRKTRALTVALIVVASAGLAAGITIAILNSFPKPDPPDQNWCEYLESIEACSDGSPD